ncbi:MAG: hypothetical protein ACMXYA_03625 [Candidatus Woesearchaeota archaeon]
MNKYLRYTLSSTIFFTGIFVGSRILPEVNDWYQRLKPPIESKKIVHPHLENAQYIIQFVYDAREKK